MNGHAITPYAIREVSPTQTEVLVYDNNFPNEERVLTINPETNEWRYFAASDPRAEAALYEGDATTLTLRLEPISPRLGQHACFFCNDFQGNAQSATLQVQSASDRAADRQHALQALENGLMSNRLVIVPTRTVDWAIQEAVRKYRIVDGEPLNLSLQGPTSGQPLHLGLSFVGQGFAVQVEQLALAVGQLDALRFEADRAAWSYATSSSASPTFSLDVELPGADYRVRVQAEGDEDGHSVSFGYDHGTQRWQIEVDGAGDTLIALQVHRLDGSTAVEFRHAAIRLQEGTRANFDLGAWAGDGLPLRMEVDANRDGTVDSTSMLSDEN